ncbi:hypothetical protein MITS9509_01188 [Synechococcus sp. MIT S9509]|uniref:hypothetical protein n=1 Tax=unclassified Synechococcus TaxID=2626047 RepID=UPI0007BB1658|nr:MULTISPECIES: hypothetical protein [unclassified Synechococcus]KZR87338.1 hypothetical protein MITS9504_00754 [Synechococcus sp. MIT S9504]KZR92739.1 hypothetical protein MITS9509_01188 [Synechococcus sp. MIT S9509]
MSHPSVDFAASAPVNNLWPALVERLGLERSQRAVRQALDLQAMQGSAATLPVLFCETCGLALASTDLLREQTGLNAHGDDYVLLYSPKSQSVQLVCPK